MDEERDELAPGVASGDETARMLDQLYTLQRAAGAPALLDGSISVETFFTLLCAGWIVDGRLGGFVVGRRHAEGSIHMVRQERDGFVIDARNLEGGEYIVNHHASEQFMARIKAINLDSGPRSESGIDLPPARASRVFNTRAEPYDRLLWVDARGQFILNRRSTARHFDELERLNQCLGDFAQCDFSQLRPK